MKNVLSAIIMATHYPSQAIKLFIEFEKAQAQTRKLKGAQKMTSNDKIKVWKCEECGHGQKCIITENSVLMSGEPDFCIFARGEQAPWQPTTDYQITERQPDYKITIDDPQPTTLMQELEELEQLGKKSGALKSDKHQPVTMQNQHLHIKGNPGRTIPPPTMQFSEIEKHLIIEAATETAKLHPIAFEGIIKTLRAIGPVHSEGGNIESLIVSRDHMLKNDPKEDRTVYIQPVLPTQRVKIIWSEVNADNVHIAYLLRNYTDEIPAGHKMSFVFGENPEGGVETVYTKDIPKTWLEPIPAEPVTADLKARNWHDEHVHKFLAQKGSVVAAYKAGHKEGEKIEKLKHAPRQTFDEWWTELVNGEPRRVAHFGNISREDALQLWQASQRNLGHEPTN